MGKTRNKKELKKRKLKKKLAVESQSSHAKAATGKKSSNKPVESGIYSPEQRILVVGDGDFSFARGLVRHLQGDGKNVTATSLDSAHNVSRKYGQKAADCIAACETAGVRIVHEVDATKLHRLEPRGVLFDRIIFNFPHSGQQRVHINRALLLSFFESTRAVMSENAEVHVTLKLAPPYSGWNIEEQASTAGFTRVDAFPFNPQAFPGYRHTTTEKNAVPVDMTSSAEARLCKTLVFKRHHGAVLSDSSRGGGGEGDVELNGAETVGKKNRKLPKTRGDNNSSSSSSGGGGGEVAGGISDGAAAPPRPPTLITRPIPKWVLANEQLLKSEKRYTGSFPYKSSNDDDDAEANKKKNRRRWRKS